MLIIHNPFPCGFLCVAIFSQSVLLLVSYEFTRRVSRCHCSLLAHYTHLHLLFRYPLSTFREKCPSLPFPLSSWVYYLAHPQFPLLAQFYPLWSICHLQMRTWIPPKECPAANQLAFQTICHFPPHCYIPWSHIGSQSTREWGRICTFVLPQPLTFLTLFSEPGLQQRGQLNIWLVTQWEKITFHRFPGSFNLHLKLRFSLKEKIDLPTLAFVRVHSCVRVCVCVCVCVCVAAMNTPTVHLGNSKSIPQMS